jgi:hypothetical protein
VGAVLMQETREAPYPADTRAKGWRFEVDMEKVKQSDTWLRAKTGEVRGALLLLWGESWQQTPCGSLPADEELVALLIDMPTPKFKKHRAVLMRGWWLADDGRLYHDTITERVFAMLEKRAKDAARAANRRARHADTDGFTSESRVTPPEQPRESDPSSTPSTKHQAPTSSLRSEGRSRAAPSPARPEDVTEQTWGDWLQLRKSKRAPVTETVLAQARTESIKAGMSLQRFLEIWCMRGSQGLQADWLRAEERKGNAQRAGRLAAAGAGMFHPPRKDGASTGEVIDV